MATDGVVVTFLRVFGEGEGVVEGTKLRGPVSGGLSFAALGPGD